MPAIKKRAPGMAKRILVVFTFRSIDLLLEERGSQAWALNAANARRCSYIVCTRNRHHENASQREEHGAAFLVGKISGIQPAPDDPARFIVCFDRYALLNPQPIIWPGSRNPVWYVDDFSDIQIDESALDWQQRPETGTGVSSTESNPPCAPVARAEMLTIAEAKRLLAATFGVSPDNIEIIVRG
jgi:hypothetical protein